MVKVTINDFTFVVRRRANVRNLHFQRSAEVARDALAAHVAGDRRVVALAGDFVDFVDKDDASLGLFHIVVTSLEQPCEERLDILAHIARLLARAPKVFWTVGLVQFFCWAAFLFMWSYSTDAIANHVFHAPSVIKVDGISINGKAYTEKYVLAR